MNDSVIYKNNYTNLIFNYYLQKYLDNTFVNRLCENINNISYSIIILYISINNKTYYIILTDYQDRIDNLLESVHTLIIDNLKVTPHILLKLKNENNAYAVTNLISFLINDIEVYTLRELIKTNISKNYLYKTIIINSNDVFIQNNIHNILKMLYFDTKSNIKSLKDITTYISNKNFIRESSCIIKRKI